MKHRKLIFIFIHMILILLAITGCGGNESNLNQEKNIYTVYTTVYPLQYFTEQIGGSYVKVETIYPPGVDEHTFEPSQKDMIEMAQGDLFLYIGYGLEGFVRKAVPILQDENVKTIAVGEEINLDHDEDSSADHSDLDHHHGINPHLWIDPIYSREMAKIIFEQLKAAIPEHESAFEENYEILADQLQKLDESFLNTAEHAQTKDFIVSHAAYTYWEDRYGLNQISISGISTAEEPSQKQLVEIMDSIKEKNLQYMLMEQNVSSRIADVIINEAGLTVLPIHNLSVLTSEDIREGRDYFSVMEDNLETLKTALGVQ